MTNPPQTPPRRLGRFTHLTPSKTPYVTPSKASQQSISVPHSHLNSARSKGRLQHDSPFSLKAGRTSPAKQSNGDRFIPSRRYMSMDMSRRALKSGEKRPHFEDASASSPPVRKQSQETPLQKEFKRRMLSSMCNIPLDRLSEDAVPSGILSFGGPQPSFENKPPLADPFALDFLRTVKLGGVEQDGATEQSMANKMVRKVSSAPIRILDAPDIVDDYYLNLISWSKDNILAVALARSVYLWNAASGEIHHLLTVDEVNNYITSVNWCTMPGHTHYVAVGTNLSMVHLFDGRALTKIRTMTGHSARVSSLAWTQNKLTSGGRDSLILNHDVRCSRNVVSTYKAHTQEVCGLKWNEDGSCLASGGNENFLCLWDASMSLLNRRSRPFDVNSVVANDVGPRLLLKHHKAAVKALDWCPFHRGLLASGGGTADRTIKFWNTSSGCVLNSIDTGSQVCSILWSRHQRELCSSHGYSENQLVLWKYPTMTKIKELTGHTARVLNMDISADGTSVVSAGADETLRFWNVFEDSSSSVSHRSGSMMMGDLLGGHTIR
jgi:cell division cycle 20, cofactor of APC complex